MTSVFIGGSRRLGRVNAQLSHRLDNIMQKKLRVLVGDANGFDRAAQAYLAEHAYNAVTVYCTSGVCRNNVGHWPINAVEYNGKDRGREFYTAKDDAMLRDANYGLFAWDGKSKGTLRNACKMAEQGKPSSVYISTSKKFVTIRKCEDVSALTEYLDSGVASDVDLFSDSWRNDTESSSPLIGQTETGAV